MKCTAVGTLRTVEPLDEVREESRLAEAGRPRHEHEPSAASLAELLEPAQLFAASAEGAVRRDHASK